MGMTATEAQIPGDYQFRALSEGWAFQRAWHRARLDLVAALAPPRSGDTVLDAGCGAGIFRRHFARSGAKIVSVDFRVAACQFVRRAADAWVAAADLCALPLRNGVFSMVYLLEVLEHLSPEDGRHALRELHRVSLENGRLLVTTPNYSSYWPVVERLLDRTGLVPPMRGEQHLSPYVPARLRQTLEATGWRVEQAGTFNLIAPLVGMVWRASAARIVSWEHRHLGRVAPVLAVVARRC